MIEATTVRDIERFISRKKLEVAEATVRMYFVTLASVSQTAAFW